jgi:excisionase family DNA binding protein
VSQVRILYGSLSVPLINIVIRNPGQTDQPHFKGIDQGVTMFLMNGYTLREAAEALGVSIVTIRRYIKSGKLKARLVPSKFGESYIIEDLTLPTKPLSDNTLSSQPLINRIEQLSQEVGYWKAKAESLQERLLLLEAPKQTPKQKWWQRLFRPWQ